VTAIIQNNIDFNQSINQWINQSIMQLVTRSKKDQNLSKLFL